MCGICGIVDRNNDNRKIISLMCDILAHRGPDNSTIFQFDEIYFGHRRLSIIDLTTGDQPIYNDDKTLGII